MNSGRELTEALKAASPQAAIREPANAALVSETEGRHGIRLPSDMAWFYRSANGMNWPTEPEHGWIRIWELELWRRIREDPDLGNVYEDLGDAILMADHCDESWWYAADFSSRLRKKQVQSTQLRTSTHQKDRGAAIRSGFFDGSRSPQETGER